MDAHLPTNPGYSCPECCTCMFREKSLRAHVKAHFKGCAPTESWMCARCKQRYTTRQGVANHYSQSHRSPSRLDNNSPEPNVDPDVDIQSQSGSRFASYDCSFCTRGFPTVLGLRNHERAKHQAQASASLAAQDDNAPASGKVYCRRWSENEIRKFVEAVERVGLHSNATLASMIGTRDATQVANFEGRYVTKHIEWARKFSTPSIKVRSDQGTQSSPSHSPSSLGSVPSQWTPSDSAGPSRQGGGTPFGRRRSDGSSQTPPPPSPSSLGSVPSAPDEPSSRQGGAIPPGRNRNDRGTQSSPSLSLILGSVSSQRSSTGSSDRTNQGVVTDIYPPPGMRVSSNSLLERANNLLVALRSTPSATPDAAAETREPQPSESSPVESTDAISPPTTGTDWVNWAADFHSQAQATINLPMSLPDVINEMSDDRPEIPSLPPRSQLPNDSAQALDIDDIASPPPGWESELDFLLLPEHSFLLPPPPGFGWEVDTVPAHTSPIPLW